MRVIANVVRASWLASLLATTSLSGWAFQAPVTAVRTSLSTNRLSVTVHFEVDDPAAGGVVAGAREYSGQLGSFTSISNLVSTNGIVAWLAFGDGTLGTRDQEVNCVVYDPALRAWPEHRRRYESSLCCPWTVTGPTIAGGVVTWQAEGSGVASALRRQMAFATYDPARGSWAGETREYTGTAGSYWVITNRISSAGLVAWARHNVGQIALGNKEVNVTTYDPAATAWMTQSFPYDAHLNNPWSITNLTIANQAVRWVARNRDGTNQEIHGYDTITRTWNATVTTVRAGFVASTATGFAPLGVWFTDLSLGATNWSWAFGDNTNSTTRSPYHVFTEPGAYTVTQTVVGPGGQDANELVVVVDAPPGELRFDPTRLSLAGGVFTMQLQGASGLNSVVLFASTNLVDWRAISTNQPQTSPLQLEDPEAGAFPRRFYRALEPH